MLPMQAAVNARLARVLGGPVWAAATSGLVLTVALSTIASAARRGGPQLSRLGELPWWAWSGGFCGAILLSATTAAAPRLGAGRMIALVMIGQVLGSLALDNFGLLGLEVQPLNLQRSIAAVLLIIGAMLMR
jgi:transporter family-2 protein